jgi:hypothetical protein
MLKSMQDVTRKGRLLGALVLGIGLASGVRAASDADPLYAGTARVDITQPLTNAVDLLGKRLAVHDPLFARVLVLKSRETSLAIVSMDLILFSSAKVVAEAKAKWKVEHVLLCATHTHAGRSPQGLIIGGGRPDWTRGGDPAGLIDWPALSADPWYAATEEKIVAAIGEAAQHLFPARVVSGRGPFESAHMAHNRRLVGKDGRATAMWDNPKRLPTEPIDPTVGFIRVEDGEGKPRAFLVHYACHPVAMANSGQLSRDFPGAMVDYVEQELGSNCIAMFMQGAEGDLDPYDMGLGGLHKHNMIQQAGISLGKGALRVAQGVGPRLDRSRSSLKVKESVLKIPSRDGKKVSDVGIMTVVINNDLALVSVPGEPFIQHQLDLTQASPIKTTLMLGLAYCGTGSPFLVYVPSVRAVKEGGYGAAECSFLAADAGERMVKLGVESIRELMGSGTGNVKR